MTNVAGNRGNPGESRGFRGTLGLQVLHVYDWTFAVTAADHLVAAVNFLAPGHKMEFTWPTVTQ